VCCAIARQRVVGYHGCRKVSLDGAIYVTKDRNGTVLRIAADRQ
jgi:hypothetical protein